MSAPVLWFLWGQPCYSNSTRKVHFWPPSRETSHELFQISVLHAISPSIVYSQTFFGGLVESLFPIGLGRPVRSANL
jgi:hypothetical protein